MGGKAEYLKPDSGVGAKFVLSFPVKELLKKDEDEPGIAINASPQKILWVDDEEDIRELGQALLTIIGHDADIAESGTESLKKLKSRDYDIVITDIGMPEMDGWELASKIKEKYPKIKIAALSGWSLKNKKDLQNSPVHCYMQKPLSKEELQIKINELAAMK